MNRVVHFEDVIEGIRETNPEVITGQMFGMPTLKLKGKAVAGEFQGAMVFKLTDSDARASALGLPGAKLFDPMGGRPMKQWVVVPPQQSDKWSELVKLAIEGMK